MAKDTLRQYLDRYAEPEASCARNLRRSYAEALVIPACREPITLLDGLSDALRAHAERVLLILVVNATEQASDETHAANAALLGGMHALANGTERLAPGVDLLELDLSDVLLVDRASQGRRLPLGEGVGLARRIGCDMALEAVRGGRLRSRWLFSTDADVVLPASYFRAPDQLSGDETALVFPFEHTASGHDPSLDRATALYEISLRYFVLGLAGARSPYAFHSIGSTLAVDAACYAQVRGFPRRQAGEDFYLLDKLAKLGPLGKLHGDPIQISARRSDRAPFGTGPGVQKIEMELEGGVAPRLYHPRIFQALGGVLARLEEWSRHGDMGRLDREVGTLGAPVSATLHGLGAFRAWAAAAEQAKTPPALLRRAHTWFDGLRTVRFVHGLRDAAWPSLPWLEAVRGAGLYVGGDDSPEQIRSELARLELALPRRVGPTCARPLPA